MNWPYIHTLVNHFPIILMVVGSAVLALALIGRRRGVWLYAVATLTLAGLSIYPAFYTGDEAAHALRDKWYIVRAAVEHDDAAGYALITVLLVGVVNGYAWWRMLRREATGLPPVWLRVVVSLVTAFALTVVIRTAYLGGKIIHESPKLENPPPESELRSVPSAAASTDVATWTVRPDSYGRLSLGIPLSEANKLLGDSIPVDYKKFDTCQSVSWPAMPHGVRLMVERDAVGAPPGSNGST